MLNLLSSTAPNACLSLATSAWPWTATDYSSFAAAKPYAALYCRRRSRSKLFPRQKLVRFTTVGGVASKTDDFSSTNKGTNKDLSSSGTSSSNDVEQLLAFGRRLILENDATSAVQKFERAVNLAPRSAVAKSELGRALVRCGRPVDGFNSLIAAFEIDSLCPGVKDGFREYYRAEIESDPRNIGLHEGLAALCVDSGRPDEAAACYRQCLDLSSGTTPSQPAIQEARKDRWSVALFSCHASLCDWDDWSSEARALRAAVRRRHSGGVGNMEILLEDDGVDGDPSLVLGLLDPPPERTQETYFFPQVKKEAEGERPIDDDYDAKETGTYAGSDPGYTNADARHTAAVVAAGSILQPSEENDVGDDDVSRPTLHPFDSLSAPLSIGDCFAVAQYQSRAVLAESRLQDRFQGDRVVAEEKGVRQQQRPGASASRDEKGRVRLGYVSGDLMGSHPLTHLMQSTFGMHDLAEFEVFLYALNADDGSKERRRMEDDVEHFHDLSTLTAREAAAIISNDGICVLVNLNGYAGTAKSADIFALRPAPLAVSYMGFPGTMGSREMVDYILADGVVIPPEMRRFYSEKVLEMPHCYFVNDYRQSELAVIESPPPSNRSQHGLPQGGDALREVRNGSRSVNSSSSGSGSRERRGGKVAGGKTEEEKGKGVVLCNFNRLHKIDPITFGAWMKVLKNVPGTFLWLLDGGETARANLHQQARLAGVEESRVIFAPLVGKEEHLQRLRLADLFVDTPLYNAHTVGCDALWAGVPMVTLSGSKMASRVGASLVEAAGLPELVTGSMGEYTRLVESLARDHGLRLSLRRKLSTARLTCPLFDTRRWVEDAEDVLRWAWERHEAGLQPVHHRMGKKLGESF